MRIRIDIDFDEQEAVRFSTGLESHMSQVVDDVDAGAAPQPGESGQQPHASGAVPPAASGFMAPVDAGSDPATDAGPAPDPPGWTEQILLPDPLDAGPGND